MIQNQHGTIKNQDSNEISGTGRFSINQLESNFGSGSSNNLNFSPSRFTSPTIEQMMAKQISELRDRIQAYQILESQLQLNKSSKLKYIPDTVDIQIFGPAGSGKSSLIRTFYRALYKTKEIPEQFKERLVIKDVNKNEGTTEYSSFQIKPNPIQDQFMKSPLLVQRSQEFQPLVQKLDFNMGSKSQPSSPKLSKKNKQQTKQNTKIVLHDTRGQLWMDDIEREQIHQMVRGKIKDHSQVQQRNYRYAYLLWEFWKKDRELFPKEILKNRGRGKKSIKNKPHCLLFVFDGSMDEIPNGEEETKFYKDVLRMARNRKYFYPQIVLTCMDKIEDQLQQNEILQKGQALDDFEKEQRLRDMIELKIEKVVLNLGVPRSSVHFIENYKSEGEEQRARIDYKALRLLHECLEQSDGYILNAISDKNDKKCLIF